MPPSFPPSSFYDVVVVTEADETLQLAGLFQDSAAPDPDDFFQALYVVARAPDDIARAIAVADKAGFKTAPAPSPSALPPWWTPFLVHHTTKGAKRADVVQTGRAGTPAASTVSAHWQVLCFLRGPKPPVAFKPRSHQLVEVRGRGESMDMLPLLDAIADHFVLPLGGKRAVVGKAGDSGLSEYDVIDSGPKFETICPARRFNISSARKSRMLKAYLGSVDATTLRHDLDALQTYFAGKDEYDPNRRIISLVPPKDHEDFVVLKPSILGQVQAQLKQLRRRGAKNKQSLKSPQQQGAKKRRKGVEGASGIGAKTPVSQALRDFLVKKCNVEPFEAAEGIPRTQVVRAIPGYIKANGLATGRNVAPDAELRKLLPRGFKDDLTYFSVFKHINHNFIKRPTPTQSSQGEEGAGGGVGEDEGRLGS